MEKLKSRKFWMTIIALIITPLTMYVGPEEGEQVRIAMVALMDAVIGIYLLAQGMVDKEKVKSE